MKGDQEYVSLMMFVKVNISEQIETITKRPTTMVLSWHGIL